MDMIWPNYTDNILGNINKWGYILWKQLMI